MLIAIAVADDVDIVAEPRRIMAMANGLAAAGVPHIVDMIRDGNQNPIWNLLESIYSLTDNAEAPRDSLEMTSRMYP
jgi:hypothetical protein